MNQKQSDPHKELVDKVNNDPQTIKDKSQISGVTGVGVTGILGTAALDTLELLGENVVEVVGGGTGIGIVVFFVVKFLMAEATELEAGLEAELEH